MHDTCMFFMTAFFQIFVDHYELLLRTTHQIKYLNLFRTFINNCTCDLITFTIKDMNKIQFYLFSDKEANLTIVFL